LLERLTEELADGKSNLATDVAGLSRTVDDLTFMILVLAGAFEESETPVPFESPPLSL